MLKKLGLIFICLSFFLLGHNQNYEQKFWIFFKDKGVTSANVDFKRSIIEKELCPKVVQRRMKMPELGTIVDFHDLPVNQPYIEKLQAFHIEPIITSKWLNAISANLTTDQLNQIKKLSFIKKIQPVAIHKQRKISDEPEHAILKESSSQKQLGISYGNSYTQNAIMHVPEIHQLGINGSGVIVGILDTGFQYSLHEALAHLKVNNEYDFINHDKITENESGDSKTQHNHGTMVLSIIAGYEEGRLIGPAYNSEYLLAKTEDIRDEYQAEEDYWVAGLEWMESKGVDIVNSSLGYTDWYTYDDYDGNTAVTTIAADIAAQKGVLVVNSMGNDGNHSGSINAPADGDSVLSIGAVYSNGNLASYSSIGPTADGRIKPDVVAMGSSVWYIVPSSTDNYGNSYYGTSFSSPLAAGVAALVLSAHPYSTPKQIRDALHQTADNADQPNNDYGWGLVNAYEAVFFHGLFFSNLPKVSTDNLGHKIQVNLYSKQAIIEDSSFVYYSLNNRMFQKIS